MISNLMNFDINF